MRFLTNRFVEGADKLQNENQLESRLTRRGKHIPVPLDRLIESLRDTQPKTGDRRQQFARFARRLHDLYHLRYRDRLLEIKSNYHPFNPQWHTENGHSMGRDSRATPVFIAPADDGADFTAQFDEIVTGANYYRLPMAQIEEAFARRALIQLTTHMDFSSYSRMQVYYRGISSKKARIRRWGLFKRVISVETYERVALLLQYRGRVRKKRSIGRFIPGKIYLYLFKNVPRYDLDLLFPNVQTRMTVKDLLLLILPAIGVGAAVLINILPQLFFVAIALLFSIGGENALDLFGLRVKDKGLQSAMPILIAFLSILIALGGFAARQWNNYRRKIIEFQRRITDALFFQTLDHGTGVLFHLLDAAEEEDTKEALLAYTHLLLARRPLTQMELDERIEAWMRETYQLDSRFDFDMDDPLGKLEQLTAGQKVGARKRSGGLIQRMADGRLKALPLAKALALLDKIWMEQMRK
ncbi:MAG: DUF3754 domain-containing protein [Leptospiraceae bacterium]|nr:DUF3754 domain-containing protein [Leptospiraceae bacterium]